MMKYLILLGGLVCFVACTKPDTFNTYEFHVSEVINHNKELNITLDSIVDSRCPSDAVCVWEGQAEVFMKMEIEDDQFFLLPLIERAGMPKLADTILAGYHIRLLEVDPYPVTTNPLNQEDYTVRLLIE